MSFRTAITWSSLLAFWLSAGDVAAALLHGIASGANRPSVMFISILACGLSWLWVQVEKGDTP